MGENEQGGMLRVVVVLGLIALIAAVVIGGVVYAKNNMQDKVVGTASLVDKAIKDNKPVQSISESDVPADAWVAATDGSYKVAAGQHVAVRYETPLNIPLNYSGKFLISNGLLVSNGDTSKVDVYALDININLPNAHLTNDDFFDQYTEVAGVYSLNDYFNWIVETTSHTTDGTKIFDTLPVPKGVDRETLSWQDWLEWYNADASVHNQAGDQLVSGFQMAAVNVGSMVTKDNVVGSSGNIHVFLSTNVDPSKHSVKLINDFKTAVDASGMLDLAFMSKFDYNADTYVVNQWSGYPNAQIAIW